MKIDVENMLGIITKIKAGTTKSEYLEGMSHVFFSGTDIISYNDKISIQYPFKTDFSAFVEADKLHKLLSKLKTGTLNIEEIDDKLTISCKTTKVKLSTIEDNEVSNRISSVSESLKTAKWKKLPDDFSPNILLCSYTASKQESDGTLTCVYVNGDVCVASDNNRISCATIGSEIDDMFIKATEIKNLVNTNPISYFSAKSWLHFKNADGCIFSIRKVTGTFPDFLQFFEFDGVEVTLPREIITGIDIASIFADVIDPIINLKIKNGVLFLSTKSDGKGAIHRVKIDYSGKEISLNINPNFLKEMMSHASSITISEDKVKLETDSGFRMITALYS